MAGGLISYGADPREVYRSAIYVDKIPKGAKPSEPERGMRYFP